MADLAALWIVAFVHDRLRSEEQPRSMIIGTAAGIMRGFIGRTVKAVRTNLEQAKEGH